MQMQVQQQQQLQPLPLAQLQPYPMLPAALPVVPGMAGNLRQYPHASVVRRAFFKSVPPAAPAPAALPWSRTRNYEADGATVEPLPPLRFRQVVAAAAAPPTRPQGTGVANLALVSNTTPYTPLAISGGYAPVNPPDALPVACQSASLIPAIVVGSPSPVQVMMAAVGPEGVGTVLPVTFAVPNSGTLCFVPANTGVPSGAIPVVMAPPPEGGNWQAAEQVHLMVHWWCLTASGLVDVGRIHRRNGPSPNPWPIRSVNVTRFACLRRSNRVGLPLLDTEFLNRIEM